MAVSSDAAASGVVRFARRSDWNWVLLYPNMRQAAELHSLIWPL